MVQVTRKDEREANENIIRRFNRKVLQSGVLAEAKASLRFEKPISKTERRAKAIIRKERKADKLNKAWQTAGNPMDTKALMTFLIGQGVDKGVIAATYKSLGIPLQSGGRVAGQGPSQTANAILKSDARAAKKATAVPQTAAPAPVAKQTPAAPQATAQFGQQWTAQAKPKKAVAESRTVSMRLELP
jgi:ribosomal protein S21